MASVDASMTIMTIEMSKKEVYFAHILQGLLASGEWRTIHENQQQGVVDMAWRMAQLASEKGE